MLNRYGNAAITNPVFHTSSLMYKTFEVGNPFKILSVGI